MSERTKEATQNEREIRRNIHKKTKAPHDVRMCVRARLMHKVLSEVLGSNAV